MIVVVAWYGATLTFPLRRVKSGWRRKDDGPPSARDSP